MAHVGSWGTHQASFMRGSVENARVPRKKISAGGPSLARTYHAKACAVEIHGEDLVAVVRRAGRLKDELLLIEGEVRFCVLSAVGQLPNVRKVFLPRQRGDRVVFNACEREKRKHCANTDK